MWKRKTRMACDEGGTRPEQLGAQLPMSKDGVSTILSELWKLAGRFQRVQPDIA